MTAPLRVGVVGLGWAGRTHAESFQATIWHLLVSHPTIKAAQTKWESSR